MFHQTGKMRSTPSCPVQLVANFNPGTGSQSYRASGKSCSRPSHYRLPFYLKDMGPRYNAISVAAHEARPGHHTQVILLLVLQKIVRRYNSCLNVTKYKVRLSNLSLLSNYSQLSDWITGVKKINQSDFRKFKQPRPLRQRKHYFCAMATILRFSYILLVHYIVDKQR